MVGFLTSLLRRFDRRRPITADSAKTYSNPVHETACQNADEFPVLVTCSVKGLS
jgi:hypothetical protein